MNSSNKCRLNTPQPKVSYEICKPVEALNEPFETEYLLKSNANVLHLLRSIDQLAYGMYACKGILFNRESSRRGETFVTRKTPVAWHQPGPGRLLFMGNIEALRDWGHAKDYVRMK